MRILHLWLPVALLLGTPFAMLTAQTTGTLEGVVQDPSGGVVSGTRLWIHEMQTGLTRSVATDSSGYYSASDLPPGIYEIEASYTNFQKLLRRGLQLSAGRVVRVDLVLLLGEHTDEVVVEAEPPMVSAAVADWGGLIAGHDLSSLPSNGRNMFDLATLKAGVSFPVTVFNSTQNGLGRQLSVKGSRPKQNSFQLDGVYINDATNSMPASVNGALLGLETIREVNIVTDPYSAEYGRATGGVFTAVSKSGTNRMHGSIYEYFRNSGLDARNYFDLPDQPIPPLRRNQFGTLVSGPVRADRSFFLLNYEGVRERRGATVRPAVPTAQARSGILPGPNGELIQVPVAPEIRPYLDLYPLPNGDEFGDGTAEFVNEAKTEINEDYASGKLDVLASPALRFAGRYTFDAAETGDPDPLNLYDFGVQSRHHFVHTELQWIRSPNTIFNFRGAFSRIATLESISTSDRVPESLSFVPGQVMGPVEVAGLADLGGFRARLRPRRYATNIYQVNGDVAHNRGRHRIGFGAGCDRVQFNLNAPQSPGGSYSFGSLEEVLKNEPRSGNVMAPGSDAVRGWRYLRFFGYVQHEFRVQSNLSVGLGVRYEVASVPAEVNGKVASLRDPERGAQVTVGGPVFQNPSKKNFAPRASLAWDPFGSGKTVVRAGGGLFFDLLGSRDVIVSGVRTPPFFSRLLVFGPAFPDILAAVADAQPPNSLDGLEFAINQPYVVRWQVVVEREVRAGMVARVEYTGARGIHLLGQIGNVNPTQPQLLGDERLFFPKDAARVNSAFGTIGMRRSQFNSFYQAGSAGVEGRWGKRLRLQMNYTFGKSIDETSHGVFLDFINADYMPTMLNYRQNRGRSNFDLKHAFTAAFNYQLPRVGMGSLRSVLGGWELHGLVQVQAGLPFSPTVGFDRARLLPNFGDLGQRPDLLGSPKQRVVLGEPQQWFDPLVFGLPQAGFYGNLGRGTLEGPGLFNIDLAVHKLLWGGDTHSLRLRGEFFNVTNHPNLAIPSGTALFNSSEGRLGTAGRITQTATPSRQIQIALRWEF